MERDKIFAIETWREKHGLSKSILAEYFGVPDRNYNNWTYRGSLPKTFYPKADQLLRDEVTIHRVGIDITLKPVKKYPAKVDPSGLKETISEPVARLKTSPHSEIDTDEILNSLTQEEAKLILTAALDRGLLSDETKEDLIIRILRSRS